MGVGDLWDEIGLLQFNFLLREGLKPHHKLLDVGCGSLRGGVHFIKYLSSGNYFGMDKEEWLLDAAREVEIPRYHLEDKTVSLICRDDFNFSIFSSRFDYALAQSVFTHLPPDLILNCLVNIQKVLKEDGKFYATFFEDREGRHARGPLAHNPGGITTYPDKDPYHYPFEVFVDLAEKAGLKVEYLGGWNHPRDQKMVLFKQP